MESRDRHYRRDSYIEGNVVRQRESVPGRSVQPAEKTREQLHQERMRKNAARQNQQRAMAMDRGYVAFLAAATVVCFLVCAIFIYLQSDVTTSEWNVMIHNLPPGFSIRIISSSEFSSTSSSWFSSIRIA